MNESPTSPCKIAIVEDDARLAAYIQSILNGAGGGIRCVGMAGSAEQALAEFPALGPDLVFLDINLPGMGGVECVDRLSRLLPGLQIVMITVFNDTETVFRALAAGAIGYLIKPVDPERVLQAVEEVRQGGAPMSAAIARRIVQSFQNTGTHSKSEALETLSPRENEILALLAKGHLMKEIANELGMARNTLRIHTNRIYKKLHVHSRSQAVAKYHGELD
jgi:DNA-binding NarL/FixJ family response regulator